MAGLDPNIIGSVDLQLTMGRINTDVRNDMILAPHYSVIYASASEELWDMTQKELRSGSYNPSLPIRMEVPKSSRFTRPGTILEPKDRLVYQLLVDAIAPITEPTLDRRRVFSNIYLSPDSEFRMFEASSVSFPKFQTAISEHCRLEENQFVLKADVANYFERIKQHNLIALLQASHCPPSAVNLLEHMLSKWTETTSFGIIQGLFASDYFGNFYLSVLDSILTVKEIQSIRYVDDVYLFFPDGPSASRGLIFLISELRKIGLSLNEAKSRIYASEHLLREETEIDRMFGEAWDEVEDEVVTGMGYGFENLWLTEEDLEKEIDFHSEALLRLYAEVEEDIPPLIEDKIEKFCLPFFTASGEGIAIERSLSNFRRKPYLAGLYSSYLSKVADQGNVCQEMERIFASDELLYEAQTMALIAFLANQPRLEQGTVNRALALLTNLSLPIALRGLVPLLIGKHGTAVQRALLRNQYADEPSNYVKSAILFATRFFPADERRACLSAWGNHSYVNTLIGQAMKNLLA